MVDGCQSSECFKGIFPDVFHELQSILNFTYTIHMPPDGEWGAKRSDGSWTGVIGQLAAREVDVAAADFRITALRGPVVDFLPPIDDPHMRLFIANPAESFNWYAYVRPYPRITWGAIALAVLVLPPLVSWLITKGGVFSSPDRLLLLLLVAVAVTVIVIVFVVVVVAVTFHRVPQ